MGFQLNNCCVAALKIKKKAEISLIEVQCSYPQQGSSQSHYNPYTEYHTLREALIHNSTFTREYVWLANGLGKYFNKNQRDIAYTKKLGSHILSEQMWKNFQWKLSIEKILTNNEDLLYSTRKFIFPGGSDSKEPASNSGNGVWSLGREFPWRREWQLTPVFLPGKFHIS